MATAGQARQPLKCQISEWGLPPLIVAWFRKKGITSLFEWQVECLCQSDVLFGGNLVYSAPTSAGKTLVADFLLLKRVLEFDKKALVIEPFVALTREKAASLKSMLFTTKARVGAFGGAYYTPGGMAAVSVAVCTIEKANNFINKLINENKLSDLGIIVVDEIHYLGDERRGHQLELLLTKVLYYNSKQEHNKRIQIVGLSATIPNLKTIATWLQASLYITEYRPVPLIEKMNINDKIYDVKAFLQDPNCEPIETIKPSKYGIEIDFDNLFCLCIDTIVNGHSALVFCESKRECEIMATSLAEQLTKSGSFINDTDQEKAKMSEKLRQSISIAAIKEILTKLDKCPAGKDTNLVKALRMGIGFHHAGLTSEEREIVEDGFKGGAIKTLMATSTLSSGVNLPARLVIIRSPMMISSNGGSFQREMLNPITYRQMIGRAGRKNIDTCGESILICRRDNQDIAFKLLQSSLGSINSSLAHRLMGAEGEPSGLKKALLEVIANGTAVTRANLDKYLRSTFWISSEEETSANHFKEAINETLRFLINKKFIEQLKPGCYKPTRLGNAVLASGLHPDESLELLQDLMKARQGFCLLNDLHIIYQVTPNDIAHSTVLRDWQHYSKIWNGLDETCQYVGERVGIDEIVIARRAMGFSNTLSEDKERVYRRYWVALIINDLVKELQLIEICKKYRMTKAFVQQAQRAVAQFAGVMSIFCNELGYDNISALVTPLETRINFSCQRDLLDLIRLNITRPIARGLFDAGYKNVIAVAKGDKLDIEFIIRQLQPFKKEQSFTGLDTPTMWVPELAKNMTTLDYANYIVDTARDVVEIEYDIDLTPLLDQKKEEEVRRLTQRQSNQPSPLKRGPSDDAIGNNQTIEKEGEKMRAKDVPSFVITYIKDSPHDIERYIDLWSKSSSISLNFKLDGQARNLIGANVNGSHPSSSRQTERCDSILDDNDDMAPGHNNSKVSSRRAHQDGLQLRFSIGPMKQYILKMYTCFDDDMTVYIVNSRHILAQVRDKLATTISDDSKSRQPIQLFTQDIVVAYKVLCAGFGFDKELLDKCFVWNSFDVAWWMVQNCPNRGLNNRNSSLSLISSTRWAKKYHHFLHPSSPRKRRRGSASGLVPELTENELGRNMDDFHRLKDVVKSGKTAILQPLIRELTDELSKRKQVYAYHNAEIPSRLTMAHMTLYGIGLDLKVLNQDLEMYEDLSDQMNRVASEQYAKSSISLTSVKDVARVLYDVLDLKKFLLNHSTNSDITKDPTNSEILKILSGYHPFPAMVRDFRKLGKGIEALRSVSTYARTNEDLKMARVMGQCDFWQLTGRVSMYDPDLFLINRNFRVTIPAHNFRSEECIDCEPRRCFIPIRGWVFVAADYSQLELRLLAHFSGDENLLEILNQSLDSGSPYDVFKTMASRIYEKSIDQVTSENRQHAKQICYGIIYGMGNRSLAGQLGVDIDQADEFRHDFFKAFPRIQEFTENLIEDCKRDGYVASLLGRRRIIPGINAEVSSSLSRAKRVAVNTRIQSSASDIIKLAMNYVHQRILDDYANSARLTLEMHDELIYEVSKDVANDFATVLRATMENVASSEELKVKLLVNLKTGDNWSNLKDFNP